MSHDPLHATLDPLLDTRSQPGTSVPPVGRGAFVRLWSLLRRDRRDLVVVLFYAALAGAFALTLPLSVGAIVQLVQGGLILQPVVILIGYVVVGTLLSGVLQVLQLGVIERIQQRVFARMALEFTFRVPRIRYETATQEDLPETMNRLFEAVTIQKSLAKFLLDGSQALLTALAGLVLLTVYHPYFSFFGIALVLALALIIRLTGPRGLETSLMESKYKYRALHWLEEQARAFHAFKFAGRSALGVQRMDDHLVGYLDYRRSHFKVLVQQALSIVLFRTLVVGGFLVLGTQLVINRQITLGQFVAAELVIVTVMVAIEKLGLNLSVVYDILTSAKKAGHVSDLALDDVGGAPLPPSSRGMAVELRGVSYRYEPTRPPALATTSVRIAPGERVAITGDEGAGTTTLLRLVAGALHDFDGTLLYDGAPLGGLDRRLLWEQVGQYLSVTDLFDGTVYENVTVGRPGIGEAEVRAAIEAVGLTDEIQAMPRGLRTEIASGGRGLPNGTIIRLLFAQAIVGAPRLLVIDDLFRNLAPAEYERLAHVLVDPARAWTVVIVTRDVRLLSLVDRVLVMHGGRVVRDGPYQVLRDDRELGEALPDTRCTEPVETAERA